MRKEYLLALCLLLTTFTGCLGDDEECQLIPYGKCAGEDLSQRDLSGMDLTGINLRQAILVKANLSGTNLAYADLSGVFATFG